MSNTVVGSCQNYPRLCLENMKHVTRQRPYKNSHRRDSIGVTSFLGWWQRMVKVRGFGSHPGITSVQPGFGPSALCSE